MPQVEQIDAYVTHCIQMSWQKMQRRRRQESVPPESKLAGQQLGKGETRHGQARRPRAIYATGHCWWEHTNVGGQPFKLNIGYGK